jgi:hypothetical protein
LPRTYVGTLKGVGRIYQQTFIDTYAKVGFAKLYDRKTPLTAADLLNECCRCTRRTRSRSTGCSPIADGVRRRARPPRVRAVPGGGNIDHTRTKARSPQTNAICERFHKTMRNEFYRVGFRKKIYTSLDELQVDLNTWLTEYDETRPHQGRSCYGKTPMQTFLDGVPLAKEKLLA